MSRAAVVTGRDVAVAGRRERDGRVVQRVDRPRARRPQRRCSRPARPARHPSSRARSPRAIADPAHDRDAVAPTARAAWQPQLSRSARPPHILPHRAVRPGHLVHDEPSRGGALATRRIPVIVRHFFRVDLRLDGRWNGPVVPHACSQHKSPPKAGGAARRGRRALSPRAVPDVPSMWQGRRTQHGGRLTHRDVDLGVKPPTVAGQLRRPNPTGHSSQADTEGIRMSAYPLAPVRLLTPSPRPRPRRDDVRRATPWPPATPKASAVFSAASGQLRRRLGAQPQGLAVRVRRRPARTASTAPA